MRRANVTAATQAETLRADAPLAVFNAWLRIAIWVTAVAVVMVAVLSAASPAQASHDTPRPGYRWVSKPLSIAQFQTWTHINYFTCTQATCNGLPGTGTLGQTGTSSCSSTFTPPDCGHSGGGGWSYIGTTLSRAPS